jgi:ribulose-bisphosphate carboxylase large chain
MDEFDKFLYKEDIEKEKHIIATYSISANEFGKAVKEIAVGQSIGNPNVRTPRETPRLLSDHLAKIIFIDSVEEISLDKKHPNTSYGIVKIAYPLANFGTGDGVTQLICTLMGGQMDIDNITSCRLLDIDFPREYLKEFKGPKIGMDDIKKRTKAINRPLLGGIVKPKTGMSIEQLEELVEELLIGGVDFIKEDEILGNPSICKFEQRVPRIAKLIKKYEEIQDREIFYAPCINGDYPYFLERAKFASQHGLKAVHLNVWAGLPAYKSLRDLDMTDTAIFFQKSGDKVMTSNKNPYSISWKVMCDLARMSGADFIHAGMWGGYLDEPKEDLDKVMLSLRNGSNFRKTVPSLSCGSHPGLVDTTVANYGNDLMMNVGGAIQGHPNGTTSGVIAMRQAMDKPLNVDMLSYMQDKPELKAAIEKWGYVDPATNKVLYKR